jgi:hypothetical protein
MKMDLGVGSDLELGMERNCRVVLMSNDNKLIFLEVNRTAAGRRQ